MTVPVAVTGVTAPGAQRDRRRAGRRVLPAETRPAARTWHRRDIEGLRAVAVLLVVGYHCGIDVVGGGFVGVDVFFVVSGFLITTLLLREIQTRGTVSIVAFYARRARRLLPAATVVLLATVAAATWWLPPLRRGDILLDAWYATGSALNYRLAAAGTDYLAADAAPSPLQHYWSLAVEEQFYLLWPPLLLLAAVGRRRTRPHPGRVYAVVGATVVVSFALSVVLTAQNAPWSYFGAHTRAWELGVGALIALSAGGCARLPRRVAKLLATFGLAAIAASAVGFTSATAFPGHAALLPVAGTAAVIAGGCRAPSTQLSAAALQGIGRLSYSWYLWHWPFLAIAPFALGGPLSWRQNVLVAGAAFVAAMLTYALVENPVRRSVALVARPWRGIAAAGVAGVLTAAACLLITTAAARSADVSTHHAPTVAGTPLTADGLRQVLAESAAASAVPANLTPSLARVAADRPQLNRDGCETPITDAAVREPCVYGDPQSPTTVVLFGDSHAGHWFPALERLAVQHRWKLVVVVKSACNAADSLIFHERLKRAYTECVAWRDAAWARIRDLRPTIVVLSSVVDGDLIDAPGGQDRAWADAWARTFDRVSGAGTALYYLRDTPWQDHDVPQCLSAHLDDAQACGSARADAVVQPRRQELISAVARERGVTVIDPVPWLCTAQTCPPVVGDVLVYRDGHHLTTAYSRLLAPLLATEMTP